MRRWTRLNNTLLLFFAVLSALCWNLYLAILPDIVGLADIGSQPVVVGNTIIHKKEMEKYGSFVGNPASCGFSVSRLSTLVLA